jgi:4-carboxymuconolactone decarboxylase
MRKIRVLLEDIAMARVSLIEPEDHPEFADLIGKIRGARRGRLINVYKLLLHSPALAEAWFALNNAVRWETNLTGRLRELVIIRIALICDAAYILRQHIPKLATAEGLTERECEALRDWRNFAGFNDDERAALSYADAVTTQVQSSAEEFAVVKAHFDERQVVELTVLIGAYNMHARVLKALDLDLEPPE